MQRVSPQSWEDQDEMGNKNLHDKLDNQIRLMPPFCLHMFRQDMSTLGDRQGEKKKEGKYSVCNVSLSIIQTTANAYLDSAFTIESNFTF